MNEYFNLLIISTFWNFDEETIKIEILDMISFRVFLNLMIKFFILICFCVCILGEKVRIKRALTFPQTNPTRTQVSMMCSWVL